MVAGVRLFIVNWWTVPSLVLKGVYFSFCQPDVPCGVHQSWRRAATFVFQLTVAAGACIGNVRVRDC